ncbi:recombinase family protein [Neogemmobacter tilapiae]|uniref:Recombinase family protein n=1 Tax=Neogemmobacter tilapiae TaxID=875041 RepID=A0A918TXY5_9RHOB|nr:recombinase family protein [Gemmobacter tilapiae]GHC66518.1 hypothetical protein GCM10007315_34130 [Gemmobacter tilapiae]
MKATVRRCALYTRKSTEEGLDQEFNSLDAQREACAAYVKSQSGEGWKALPTVYDDGGYSGGTMERPALQQLLADVAAGRIDVIVVYKIDRLSRSLADFVRMVEIFDRHGVSFVSVTQAFNTTTSMGRLTLNVLLSFAQFEREVTGERIRDKIAASKKKGMWMGGTLPLGYDRPATGSRTLLVNAGEAVLVRHIFESYLASASVHALERQLQQEGVVSKRCVASSGQVRGGVPFSRGALFHLLRNRLYLGEIPHRDMCHPGLHEAIVEPALFDAVQQKLDAHVRRRGKARDTVAHAPLTGRIFDADDQVMSPAFAYGRGGKLYRYYVTASLQQGGKREKGDEALRRVSAAALEARLVSVLERLLPEHSGPHLDLIIRVELHASSLELLLPIRWLARMRARLLPGETADADATDPSQLRLSLPVRLRTRGGHTEIIGGEPAASKPDPVLIKALRAAHALLPTDRNGTPILEAAPESSYQRRLVRLAFLAPDLQAAILEGRQPADLTLAVLMAEDMPLSWANQRQRFGARVD